MLICPPRNHFAHGTSHSSTLSHGLNQCNSRAMSAQKPSGSAEARARIFSYSAALLMMAFSLNSFGGGKLRLSVSVDSIFWFGAVCCVDIDIASDECLDIAINTLLHVRRTCWHAPTRMGSGPDVMA